MDDKLLTGLMLRWLDPEPDDRIFDNFRLGIKNPGQWSEAERGTARALGDYLAYHNEFAVCAHEVRQNYIVGQGFTFEVVDATPEPTGTELERQAFADWVKAVQTVNELDGFEKETLFRIDRHGEAFIRIFDGESGFPEFRFVEPAAIRSAQTPLPGELFGIICDERDYKKVLGYRVWYNDTDNEVVDERDIVHIKGRATGDMRRGVPLFNTCAEGLIESKNLLRGMTKTAQARAKIAAVMKLAKLSKSNSDQVLARLTQQAADVPGPDKDRNGYPIEKMPWATMLRINSEDSLEYPAASMGTSEFVEALQARLRACAVSVTMSEWMFTGLADQKYSNAFVVEGPTLVSFRSYQGALTNKIGFGKIGQQASLLWRAFKRSIRLSNNSDINPTFIDKFDIKTTGPMLESRDPSNEATVNNAYIGTKVLSRQTVRERIGVKNDEEEARIIAEAKIDAYAATPAQGVPTPATVPGQTPAPPAA